MEVAECQQIQQLLRNIRNGTGTLPVILGRVLAVIKAWKRLVAGAEGRHVRYRVSA